MASTAVTEVLVLRDISLGIKCCSAAMVGLGNAGLGHSNQPICGPTGYIYYGFYTIRPMPNLVTNMALQV